MNADIFPELVLSLTEADIPIKGVKAYLSQGDNHQIIFMAFSQDADLPEHEHESQWGLKKTDMDARGNRGLLL